MVVAIRSAADVGTSVSGQRLCVAYVLLSFLGFDKMNVGLGIVVAIGALFSYGGIYVFSRIAAYADWQEQTCVIGLS